jgi:DNA/RNA-binding domain of Phe-tRNA-synthetase-like protein
MLTVAPHPLLDLAAFVSDLPRPLGEITTPPWLLALQAQGAPAPLQPTEAVQKAVRDLLRHGGYKPTGRGKPASEYLLRRAGEGEPASINVAVDVGNVVSLRSGLPISVVDLELLQGPLEVRVAGPGASYVFNASGQSLSLEGLLCLFDADGPCATAVKDSQRSKTRTVTRKTLSIVWGAAALRGHTAQAVAWYHELLERVEIGVGRVLRDEG